MERVSLAKKVLSENDRIAADLRRRFADQSTLVLNFISSPGSGKTLLLERTLAALPKDLRIGVLTGDIQTDNDARRFPGAADYHRGRLPFGRANDRSRPGGLEE